MTNGSEANPGRAPGPARADWRGGRTRWVLLGAILALAIGGVAVALLSSGGSGNGTTKPNVVVIVTDDQTLESMNQETMPNTLKLLGEEGTTFTNAVVTTPLCCPSRASLITGQYSHNHGILLNNPGYPALESKRNVLPSWMQRAGYRTAHVGKFLNNYEDWPEDPADVAPGWDEWRTLLKPFQYYDYGISINGTREEFGDSDEDYLTTVLTDSAVELIREQADRPKPLFLQLDYLAPHFQNRDTGGRCGNYPVPGPGDEEAFVDATPPQPPSYDEKDVSDKPAAIRAAPRIKPKTARKIQIRYGCEVASLLAVDRGIARIYDALDETGELEETMIVFLSDNGFFHGEHRLPAQKGLLYEEAVRVPLLIRLPQSLRGGVPRTATASEPVANIDLPPTILELAGADPCRSASKCRVMDGRSLLGLLRGDSSEWPQDRDVLLEVSQRSDRSGDDSLCSYVGVRSATNTYIEHVRAPNPRTESCVPSDEVENYDLTVDGFQLENLAPAAPGAPGFDAEQTLTARLAELEDCAGIPGRDPEPASGHYCE
jgi:N-acetylglucosamine-6-sulfatase